MMLAASGSEELELINACGPPGQQAWLCSTVHDITGSASATRIADDLAKPFRILVILLVAYLLVRISRLIIRRTVKRLARDEAGDQIAKLRRRTGVAFFDTGPVPSVRRALRAETTGAVLRSLVAAMIWATALLMILDTLSVNLAAIGIGASIIGVAVGFGSQSLVRDFLSGFFMLVEDQYGVGDVIDTGVATGTVEGVSLRTTRLRDLEGVVWHVPNGEIRRVGNKSQQWARAILDVAIAYDSDLAVAEAAIQGAAEALSIDPEFREVITGPPEVIGVEQITNNQVVMRLGLKTKPLEQWRVARELRARVKTALDDAGIRPGTTA
jgi:small-conductance mechanosensitive channel